MTDRMTNEQLNAIRARVEAATDAPWEHIPDYDKNYIEPPPHVYNPGDDYIADCRAQNDVGPASIENARANAAFIAHARQDIPALLAEVDALRAELAETENDNEFKRLVIDASFAQTENALNWMRRMAADNKRLEAKNERFEAERQQERAYSAGLLAMQDELYHAAVHLEWTHGQLGYSLDNMSEGDDSIEKAIARVNEALRRTEMLSEEEVAEAHMTEVARLRAELAVVREAAQAARDWLGLFGEHAPIVFGGEAELDAKLHAALENVSEADDAD